MEKYSFFDIINELTGSKKMSYTEMANRIFDCSVSYLTLIRKGERRIPNDFFNKIIEAFPNITIEQKDSIYQNIRDLQTVYDKKYNKEVEMKQKEIVNLLEKLTFLIEQHRDVTKIGELTSEIIKKIRELSAIGGVPQGIELTSNLFSMVK